MSFEAARAKGDIVYSFWKRPGSLEGVENHDVSVAAREVATCFPTPAESTEAIVAVGAAGVHRQQPVQPDGQIGTAFRPEDRVEVIGHPTPRPYPHGGVGRRLARQAGERREGVEVGEDRGPTIAAVGHIIAVAAHGGTSRSGHTGNMDPPTTPNKRATGIGADGI